MIETQLWPVILNSQEKHIFQGLKLLTESYWENKLEKCFQNNDGWKCNELQWFIIIQVLLLHYESRKPLISAQLPLLTRGKSL